MKRVWSFVLAILLCVSLLPLGAMAEEEAGVIADAEVLVSAAASEMPEDSEESEAPAEDPAAADISAEETTDETAEIQEPAVDEEPGGAEEPEETASPGENDISEEPEEPVEAAADPAAEDAAEEASIETGSGEDDPDAWNDDDPAMSCDGASAESWSLMTVDGRWITQDTFADKTILFVFYRATMQDGEGLCYNSNSTISSLAEASWTGSEEIRVIAVDVDGNDAAAVRTYQQTYAPDNGDILFALSDGSLMWSILTECGVSGSVMLAVGAIVSDGTLLGCWTANTDASTCWECISAWAEETPADGWVKDGEDWYYYKDGVMVTSAWQKDSAGWCYLGSDGKMVKNAWQKDSSGWCWIGSGGHIVTSQWVKDGGCWYWLDASGHMVYSGWKQIGGEWYYFYGSGKMAASAWMKDSVGWLYLGANGKITKNAWQKDSKGWCFLGSDGYMVTSKWQKDSHGWCYLGSDGRMVISGWVKTGGCWYYLDASGYMATGWKQVGGKWYYMNSSGIMQTGRITVGAKKYFLGSDGAMKTGWIKDGDLWYYANSDGTLVCGQTKTIDGKEYRFSAEGVLQDDSLSEEAVYQRIIAQKANYPEGMRWTNDNTYEWACTVFPDMYYTGAGCVAFAMILSDAAFGDREGRVLTSFSYSDLRVGDILRINQDTHSVIILEVHDTYLVIAEGNYNSSVHWGRTLSKSAAEAASEVLTRYPDD